MTISIPTVSAGDLIRAEVMNQIISALNSLDNRITALEVVGPSTPGLIITNIIPNGPVRISEQMEILGHNFGFSTGGLRLFLDGIRILDFRDGTSDDQLIYQVPVIPNVPDAGKAVMLSVSNQTQTENRTVVVLPQQIALGGNADVTFQSATPATLVANQPATFRYKVKSRANQQATFTIPATVSGVPNASDWNNVLVVLNDDDSANSAKTVSLAADEEKFFKVRLIAVPATPPNAVFTLAVTVQASGVTATPDSRNFTVGQPAELQDASIDLNFFGSVPPAAFSGGTIRLAPGGQMKIVLIAQFHTVQTLNYSLTQGIVTGSGWTVERNTANTSDTISIDAAEVVGATGATRHPEFIVRSQAGSANSGQVFFQLLKQGGTVPRKLTLNLGRPIA
jgi:hypothetical protein